MKLLVHIGAGKTGSSSIQAALESSSEDLSDKRVKYLGIMLENGTAPAKKQWQVRPGSALFFQDMNQEEATEQLKQVLVAEMKNQENSNKTLIWSNEWLFERTERVLPALQLLKENGVEIEIVAYIRSHDRWITSSYIQWGIKNKTYPGPIRGFQDWLKGRDFSYERILKPWIETLGSDVTLLNYDVTDDVVQHFFKRIGVPAEKSTRVNVSPASDKLAAWSVFNNRFQDPVPASRFENLLTRLSRTKKNLHDVPEFETLMPTIKDLEKLREIYGQDKAFTNKLLQESGEGELEFGEPIKAAKAPSGWEMDRLLLEMVFNLQARIMALENPKENRGAEKPRPEKHRV